MKCEFYLLNGGITKYYYHRITMNYCIYCTSTFLTSFSSFFNSDVSVSNMLLRITLLELREKKAYSSPCHYSSLRTVNAFFFTHSSFLGDNNMCFKNIISPFKKILFKIQSMGNVLRKEMETMEDFFTKRANLF